MVPLQSLGMKNRYGDGGENGKGNGFLDDFQLHQAKGAAVDFAADGVGGNHEAVFQKCQAPAGKDDKNQRPVGADVHFLELKVAVPGEGHKDIGTAEK